MVTPAARRARQSRIMVLVTAFGLATFMLLGWYAVTVGRDHEQLLRLEADRVALSVRRMADSVMVRLKDAAGLIASGHVDVARDKVETGSRQSPYLIRLGYFSAHDPSVSELLVGTTPPNLGSAQTDLLVERLRTAPALTFTFNEDIYPDIFDATLDEGMLVLSQIMPSADPIGSDIVVYAVFDVRQFLLDLGEQSLYGEVGWLYLSYDNRVDAITTGRETSVLERFLPRVQSRDVQVSNNLELSFELVDKPQSFIMVALLIGGIVGLELVAILLFLRFVVNFQSRERTLRQTAADAEEASRAKSTFLANMSHEIRTPLNGILGMAELASRTDNPDKLQGYVAQILSSGNLLLNLLNDVLDLAKAEAGQIELDPIPTQLETLISETAQFYLPTASRKGLELLIDFDPRMPQQLVFDPLRMRQVIGNLVGNAIKFTARGHVVLGAYLESIDDRRATIYLTVADTGIGISDTAVKKLFSRFNQAERGTTRLYGGSGLGLSICKHIVEAADGEIGVVSELGAGSTFTVRVTLPVAEEGFLPTLPPLRYHCLTDSEALGQIVRNQLAVTEVDCHVVTSRNAQRLLSAHLNSSHLLIIDENILVDRKIKHMLKQADARGAIVIGLATDAVECGLKACVQKPHLPESLFDGILAAWNEAQGATDDLELEVEAETEPFAPMPDDFDEPAASTAVPSGVASTAEHGIRVLLADDNEVNLAYASAVLEDMGCEVTTADNGQDAVDKAQQSRFDIILMDCQMPVMDGYEATGVLRQLAEQGRIDDVPIIALTANALRGDREMCLNAGMNDFLSKPVKPEHLERVIGKFVPGWSPLASEGQGSGRVSLSWAERRRQAAIAAQRARPATMPDAVSAPPPAPAPAATALAAARPAPAVLPITAPAPAPVVAADRPKIPVLDLELFNTCRATVRQFDNLLDIYLRDSAQYLSELGDLLALEEVAQSVMPAHTLKSSSLLLGAMAIHELAKNFEQRARAGAAELPNLRRLHAHMLKVFAATEAQLKQANAALAA